MDKPADTDDDNDDDFPSLEPSTAASSADGGAGAAPKRMRLVAKMPELPPQGGPDAIASKGKQYIGDRLEALQPIVFSARSQRGFVPRGKRDPDINWMTQSLEFETGCRPGTFELTGEFENPQVVDGYLKEQAQARGNRASDLTLPPNWPEDGVYEWVPKELEVKQNFTKEVFQLTSAHTKDFLNPDAAVISNNYSETDCAPTVC